MAYANNKSSARKSSDGRVYYDEALKESAPLLYEDDKLMNIWSSASQKYGRIDLYNQVVYPNETKMTHHDDALVFDFVAECLSEMKEYINTSIALETLDPEVGSLFPVKIHNGYVDIHTRYTFHMQELINSFLKKTIENGAIKTILTYKDFETSLLGHSRSQSTGILFSKNHFYSSKYGSPMMSGLFVETNLIAHDNDQEKIKIIMDNNFPYFVDTARRHGFFVDKNAPWRLVVDIRSCYIRNKLKSKGVNNINQFFETYYSSSHEVELENNIVFLKEMWNAFCTAEPLVDRLVDTDSGTVSRTHKRTKIENQDSIPKHQWVKSYIRVRSEEMFGEYSPDYVLDLLNEVGKYLEHDNWKQKIGKHIETQLMRKKYKKSLTKGSDIYTIIDKDCPDVVEVEPTPQVECEITDDDFVLPDSDYEEPQLPEHIEHTLDRVTEGRVWHSVHSTPIAAEEADRARIEDLGTATPINLDP